MRTLVRAAVRLAAVTLPCTLAAAQAVSIDRVEPIGAQRGTTVELTFRGQGLGGAQALVFDRDGLEAHDVESPKADRVRAQLVVAADAPLGPHALRVRTHRGLSEPVLFHVGALPVVDEVEPNSDLGSAQTTRLGVTIHGEISGEDEDVFAIAVPQGTRVRAVVEGLRAGSRDFDPLVEWLAADGRVLARGDDSSLVLRDSIVEATVPDGATCYVRIRDAARRARSRSKYRLHVDAGAQPIATTALSLPPSTSGVAAESRLLLGSAGLIGSATPRARDLTVDTGWAPAGAVTWWPEASLAPLVLRESSLGVTREAEPNDERKAPQALPPMDPSRGQAVEGVLERPGDVDHFSVELEKGAVVDVAVWARRLRSPLDPTLSVRDPDGKAVYADDDSGLDAVERVTAKKAGRYTIRVGEYLGRGGPDHVYRLEVTPVAPSVGARIPGPEKQLAVPRGRRAFVRLGLERQDRQGPLELEFEGLSAGVIAVEADGPVRGESVVVVFEALDDAPLGHSNASVTVRSRTAGEGASVVHGRLREELVIVEGPNNTVVQGHVQSRLPIAVTERVPFDVSLDAVAAPLVRSGRQDVVVRVTRDEGYTAPITVGLTALPAGVRTRTQERLDGDTLEARFSLDASADSPVGARRFIAWARAQVDGVLVSIASEYVTLEVVPTMLAHKAKRGLIEREGESALVVDLSRAEGAPETPFEVRLVGLPHDVESDVLQLEAGAGELAFPLRAGPKAPTGLHRGLSLEARVASGEGTMRQMLSGIELRVQPKAKPPKAAAVEASASRLDRLRAEHAARVEDERADTGETKAGSTESGESPADAPPVEASSGESPSLSSLRSTTPRGERLDHRRSPRARLVARDGSEDRSGPVERDEGEASAPAIPSFLNDVVPVLTASGCNAGACHGASRGQDGFHLSLFGYDAAGDYGRLLVERFARRIDLAFPEESLLLTKATGAVPHTGGALLEKGGDDYATLLAWIRAGAPDDVETAPRVVDLALEPRELVLAPGEAAELRAVATYTDGSTRDVTRLSLLRTDDATVASLERDGTVRTGSTGEAFLTAAFATETVGAPVIVREPSDGAPWVDPAAAPETWIDALIAEKLRAVGASPAPLCSDEEFLRRVTLDLVGLPPTLEERRAFLGDPRPSVEKRRARVDELLQRPEFMDQWCMRIAELLRIRSSREIAPKAAQAWFEWLQRELRSGTGIDEIVRRQLTARGDSFDVPEVGYFLIDRDPKVVAEGVAQAFLGVRISCAQCHNHPFDRWTQDDYAGFIAFFSEVRSKRAEDPNERTVSDRRGQGFRHPTTNEIVAPKFLGGDEPKLGSRLRREVIAEWLVAPENPWFARNLANRVWASLMGRGVVEPVDDVRVSNPPSSEALLEALATRLVESDFDLRDLAREITLSRVYQRTSTAPENAAEEGDWDRENFAAFRVRRLRAETLSDAIAVATGVDEDLPRLAPGERATQLADGADSSYFLRTFGRTPRETSCACEVSDDPSLSQALHLVNGRTVHSKVTRGAVVRGLVEAGADDREALDTLFARALCRAPDEAERSELSALLADAGEERRAVLEDIFWALLTSNEFLFQR